MFKRLEPYSKILIALVAALLTSQLLVREVFLGYSPTVRTDLADRLVERSLALVNIDRYLALFRGNQQPPGVPGQITPVPSFRDRLAAIPPRQLVKGVYAKESDEGALTEVRFYEIEWEFVPYQKRDGTTVTIKVPKGQAPPPPGLF